MMYQWNCCRTCLSSLNLYPIFLNPEQSHQVSAVVFSACGLKVELNDSLPQEMCSVCINFINNSISFRRKCELTNQVLLNSLKNKQFDVAVESSHIFKTEPEHATAIDVSNVIDDALGNNDVTTPLNLLQSYQNSCEASTKSVENKPLQMEYETSIPEFIKRNPIVDILICEKTTTVEISDVAHLNQEGPTLKMKSEIGKVKTEKTVKVEQIHECEICYRVLKTKQALLNHYKIHEYQKNRLINGVKFVCEHCGMALKTRRRLVAHCRSKHGYKSTDKCSYCDYTACRPENLKVHVRLHTGEKPYVCKECGAAFRSRGSYNQHVAIHLPEKTVQCELCPARFKSIKLKNIHKNRHKTAQNVFLCKVCGSSFRRRYNTAKHLQRVHGLAPDKQLIDKQKI